ncbi:TfoX/Sxy family protein [Parvularcula dongshanensis]|uniref:TfoX/Sxy family transcriptional regulator of competence genes n=1 Tax=Parvularcula dongshanensis TaxID=1173995 RepID=A0A840I703_9PROT|nr:TfoX/Sxy family protein [Parvularcula dongshanensis]MBB4660041.1 TfoX/Sxy family transcriptional regulator of competence genes [Parvularcula dongshanensis]
MATQVSTAEYLTDQLSGAGDVAVRKMFGEYGVYCDGKMFALICDDRLYLKPTEAGRAFAPDLTEEPPYPNAKPHLLVPEERWDDADWMAEAARRTLGDLPLPKPRKKKAKT